MKSVSFNTKVLQSVLSTYTGKLSINVGNDKITKIELSDSNKELLSYLRDNIALTKQQISQLSLFLDGDIDLEELTFKSVKDLSKKLLVLNTEINPVFEIKINSRWYPILANINTFKSFSAEIVCSINFYSTICNIKYNKFVTIYDDDFKNNEGKVLEKTISQLLEDYDIRLTTKENFEKTKEKNDKALRFASSKENLVYDTYGQGLMFADFWGWQSYHLGSENSVANVIIEPTLENRFAINAIDDSWKLPFVRVFSLKHKQYFYVDIEDLKEHTYHTDLKDKIILPKDIMGALNSVFSANSSDIFGDIFYGRHGGIVILANGSPGTGKTLCAEVFSEYQKRPLYSMEMSEIGTTVTQVEANLQKIFARAKKWNAVLLFDEADIFLAERAPSELERSAIVGIFLRLLDYYEGTFFLTTNRGEFIDKAFKSRVTLYLNFPELTPEVRVKIWKNMLAEAEINVDEDSFVSWNDIAEVKLNGRQIRNQVRLLKLMYKNSVKTSVLKASLNFAAL